MDLYSRVICTFTWLMCVVTIVTCSDADTCSDLRIGELHDECLALYNLSSSFYHGVPNILLEAEINTLCSYLGNISTCLDRNTAACASLYHDTGAYNNTFNLICNNKQLMMRSQLYCEPETMFVQCLRRHNEDIVYLQHYYSVKTTIPVLELCKAYSTARSCIHVKVTSSCTSDMSSFLTELYKGRFLPSACKMTSQLSATTESSATNSFGTINYTISFVVLLIPLFQRVLYCICVKCWLC